MKLTRRTLLAAAPAALAQSQPAARPNILWLSCEDTGPQQHCYGDPTAITPTIDKLASEGIRYTRAYTVAGVCAPSRSGIITGMYPSSLGSQHMRCQAKLPPHVKAFPEYLRTAGYYCTNNVKTDYNFPTPKTAWDEVSNNAHWKNRKPGQPFFAVFNNTVSHESQVLRRGAAHEANVKRLTPAQRQDPAKVALPPYYADTPESRRDWANYLELITAVDYWVADHLREIAEAGLENDTIVLFWGDHGVGLPRAKRWLYEQGTLAPLVVRIPAKFRAAGQGKPGTVDDQLVSFIDLAPTVLNLAGAPLPEHFQGRAFLGPKLSPPRQYIHGARDRMDERYDLIRAVRDKQYRYIRNYRPEKPYYQKLDTQEQGTTMKELRRVHAEGKLPPAAAMWMALSKPAEELYDANADPFELKNLAAKPELAPVLRRLRAEMDRWQDSTLDTGLLPEPELEAGEQKLGSRWAILRQPEHRGLLPRLRAAANACNAADIPKLAAMLHDPAAGVRWWAVKGLADRPSQAAPHEAAIAPLLADPSAAVRIEAARALAKLGREAKALPLLVAELDRKNPSPAARIFAATVLEEMGGKALPARAALEATLPEPRNQSYAMRVAKQALEKLPK